MNTIFDVLHARRPPINYVSPAACEVILSGSGIGSLILLLEPFGKIPKVTGVIVFGEFPGPFSLDWNRSPGDGPPVICYNIYQVVGGTLTLIAECVHPGDNGFPLPPGTPGGGDTYVVTPITSEGEGPPSSPISTPTGTPPSPCGSNEGEDTTCAYGPTGAKYRIKDFNSALFDITDCGLTYTNCINCEIAPDVNCVTAVEWSGTWPVKVDDGFFIDQEFEPDPSCGDCFPGSCPGCVMPPPHKLHGYCINSFLATSGAANSTGCGWRIEINAPFVGAVWVGVKDKGEGPVGKYFRSHGCCPGPECVEVIPL